MIPIPSVLLRALAVWIGVMMLAGSASAATRLTSIQVAATGSNTVSLRFMLSGPAPSPSVFTVDDPARISIDLPGTALALDQRYRPIGKGAVEAITAAAGGGKTRVVIELTRMTAYHIQRRGNQMIVDVGNNASSHASRPTSRYPATSAASGQRPAKTIRNIDFRRGDQGTGRIEVTLNTTQAAVNVSRRNSKIVATLPGVTLPARLAKRLDVTDFATPVRTIDAMRAAGGTRLVITPVQSAPFQRLAYQTGHKLYIELQPLTDAEQKQRQQNHPRYNGKKISLSFQHIKIRAVLQIIADVANVNMVVSDSVSGTMALKLDNVPWDQALDIILNAKGLGMTRNNNVITVAPLTEIAQRATAKAKAQAASQQLAPLHSEIIQINYAQAADIANILESNSAKTTKTYTPAPSDSFADEYVNRAMSQISTRDQRTASVVSSREADQHSLLSPRGHVTVDNRTNSLLVTDTRAKIDQIHNLINRLDIPVRQVLIESRIVVANRNFSRNLGISQTGVNNSNLNNALSKDFNYDANNRGYSVSLPATDATSLLSTSIISDTFSLNLELSAMESENNGEIISSPRIITADGQEANIEQGREIPYQSGTRGSDQGTSVEFKKAVLGLNVTPKITPNKKVIMNLNVTQDSVGKFVPTSGGGSVPSIDTRSLTTQVLVNNGDTVVLGGIYEQTNRDETDGVPFIAKIPLLGALFKSHSRQRDKQELLIFVTPKILDRSLTLGSR